MIGPLRSSFTRCPRRPARPRGRFYPVRRALATLLALATALAVVPPTRAAGPETTAPAETPKRAKALVAFLGDSLTAGYGLDQRLSYPVLIGQRLAMAGEAVDVINAGVTGDTSAGGLRRVEWLLSRHPDVVVVALGANDGLRGLPVDALERNLETIIERVQASGAHAVLAGMKVPPSLGPDYAAAFEAVYPRVAKKTHAALIPFLLEGVAARPELNQEDGIHPTARGQELVADLVLPYVKTALAK